MGFFSHIFHRIIKAQTSMGDNMVRLGRETGRLDLTMDAADAAYKTAKTARELDGLTSAAENKIASRIKSVKVGRNSYAIQFDYNTSNQQGISESEADLDFLKKQASPLMPIQGGMASELVEDAYGRLSIDPASIIMKPDSGTLRTQLLYFSDMYKKNGAIITKDGSVIKGETGEVTVDAVSDGLKSGHRLENIAAVAEKTAEEVIGRSNNIIKNASFAVHPQQTEKEIQDLARRVQQLSEEIRSELEALHVKDELKQEIFGWIKEAADKSHRYICAEIQNAIIFLSNQLDADKVNNPDIKNPSVIIAGLDARGVPEKLVQFDTIEDCRRELGAAGEKFTDMSMLRELSSASREFDRIAQMTTSEHIEDVIYRLEKAMRDYESDIKFDGANSIVDKVIEANNLKEQAYEKIKAYVEERVLGDSAFIKSHYPEKYEAFFKEVGAIYLGSAGGIANIDVLPIERVVNFEEAKGGAEPIKDLSFMLTVTSKTGEIATISYDTDMTVIKAALGTIGQKEHSIEWSSADMKVVFDAKEGLVNGFDNASDFALRIPPLQNAIQNYHMENPAQDIPER